MFTSWRLPIPDVSRTFTLQFGFQPSKMHKVEVFHVHLKKKLLRIKKITLQNSINIKFLIRRVAERNFWFRTKFTTLPPK